MVSDWLSKFLKLNLQMLVFVILLQLLPFIGSIYILGTRDNMSGNEDILRFNWFNRKRLTKQMREEFSLYNLN